MTLSGPVDEYVASFKKAARGQGYEEQVDQSDAAKRVIAYSAPGDKTLTLSVTGDGTVNTVAIVLLTP